MCGHFVRFMQKTVAAGLVLAVAGLPMPAAAAQIDVAPGTGALQRAIEMAETGDIQICNQGGIQAG